jgi:RHS repeat-associated protein
VTKTWGQQVTTYVYDAMGNLAVEYGNSTTPPCTTCFVSVDQLGSTGVLTDSQGNVKERHDYMPYGAELLAGVSGRTTAQGYLSTGGTPGTSVLFTGQYRDTELASSQMPSGLDYFGARHHAPAFGRFMQPDPAGSAAAYPGDPQSWHLYNYVTNKPLTLTDPGGLQPFGPGGDDCQDDPSCGWDWWWGWGWGWPPAWGGSGGPPPEPTPHPNPPLPSGTPNTTGTYGQGQYGLGPYANGYAPAIALGGTTICVGSGVCEVVVTAAGVGATLWATWKVATWATGIYFARKADVRQFAAAGKQVGREPGCRPPTNADFEVVHEIIKDLKDATGKVSYEDLLDAWRQVLCGQK